jgi:predicted outer membrane repeat protein
MIERILTILLCTSLLVGCTSKSNLDFSNIEHTNVIYVNVANSTPGNGSSWEMAYTSLQEALASSVYNDEIWVAAGTYYPSEDDPNVSFTMVDNVSIYGGFSGDEICKEDRDWQTNKTILSGDIGESNVNKDNSIHVVIAANGTLDGFIISNGNSSMERSLPSEGKAPIDSASSPESKTLKNPSSTDKISNYALLDTSPKNIGHSTPDQVMEGDSSSSSNGAGIIICETAPTIANCTITNNSAGKAGGIYIIGTSELEQLPKFFNCTISDNFATQRGGGVSIDMRSSAIFIDCIFNNNTCEGKGGAMYNDFGCSPMLENCLFVNNIAESGAAIANDGVSNPKIRNCTFYGNKATEAGAALYQGTGPFNDPAVIDSIIWGNICEEDKASVYSWNECNANINYSLVQNGYLGEEILDTDPLFVDAENMDFDLKEESPCLTASSDGERIGFNDSLIIERTYDDYSTLIENLQNILLKDSPTGIDLTNPMDSKDISEIGDIIYVKENGNGNGNSWYNPMGSIQDAIDYANAKYNSSGEMVKIWVAKGIYYTGDERSDSIILREGVNLYGGFNGSESTINQRDYSNNATILSGDIGVVGDATDNSYHVLIGADSAVIDGFTITGGHADKQDGGEVYDNKGSGLLNYAAGTRVRPDKEPTLGFDTTVVNCIFENNYAEEGAASYTYHGGNPIFKNCIFSNNTAEYGGASLDRAGTNAIYIGCEFVNNNAIYKGGAVFVDYGSMSTFDECTFNNNTSNTAGGAIYVIDRASQDVANDTDFALIDDTWSLITDIYSSVLIENSTFTNNIAGTKGGAVYVYEGSFAKIVNSNFDGNTSKEDAAIGIYYGSTLYLDDNTNFINNLPQNIYIGVTTNVIKN